MTEGMRDELARQVARLLEEAERPMRAEEILPHLHPVMPSANDIVDALAQLAAADEVQRDGSYFARPTPLPIDTLFASRSHRAAARAVVELVRELDERSGEGARLPAVVKEAVARGWPKERVLDVIAVLRNAGELYSAGGDRIRVSKPGPASRRATRHH